MSSFKPSGPSLTITFQSQKAAEHFKHWLCGQGEQDYWTWMEYREQEEKGNITGLNFDYHKGSEIPVSCGRLDKDESP